MCSDHPVEATSFTVQGTFRQTSPTLVQRVKTRHQDGGACPQRSTGKTTTIVTPSQNELLERTLTHIRQWDVREPMRTQISIRIDQLEEKSDAAPHPPRVLLISGNHEIPEELCCLQVPWFGEFVDSFRHVWTASSVGALRDTRHGGAQQCLFLSFFWNRQLHLMILSPLPLLFSLEQRPQWFR